MVSRLRIGFTFGNLTCRISKFVFDLILSLKYWWKYFYGREELFVSDHLLFGCVKGGSHLKAPELSSAKSATFGKTPKLIVQRKSNQLETNHKFSIRAEYG